MIGNYNTYQKQLCKGGRYQELPTLIVIQNTKEYYTTVSGSVVGYQTFWDTAQFQGAFILHLLDTSQVAYISIISGIPGKERAIYLRKWVSGQCRTVYLTSNGCLPNRLISELNTLLTGWVDFDGVYAEVRS